MSIMLRNQYSDLVLEDALPALEFIVQEQYEMFPTKYDILFNVKDMLTSIAQSTQVSSLQPAGQVGEAEQVPLQQAYQGYDKTYTAVKYGIMLATSQELIDDLRFDVMSENPKRLNKAFMHAVEIAAAAIFNNAFATNGPDGVPLSSTAHPILAPGVGTSSNQTTAADLTMTVLKSMVTGMRAQLDSGGNRVQIQPRHLLVHPSNEFNAYELLKSQFLVDSSNANVNAVNSVSGQYAIQPVVWDYLTDDDASFLVADKMDHNLCFWWRQRPEISTSSDFKTGVLLTKMLARFVAGFSDWRGVQCNAGA